MRRILASIALLGLAACAEPDVSLSYRLEEGLRLGYRLVLEADITRTIEGESRRERLVATFQARQEILESAPDGTTARMSLDPVSLLVDGEETDAGPEQEFLVTLDGAGRVVNIERAAGEAAEALTLVGIERLLPRLRPVLPGREVVTGDTWSSDVRFEDEQGAFSLESRSRLAELGSTGGHRAALVRTTYTSPVRREEVLANAVAELVGRDVGTQEAWFALEGFLVRASGDSVGRYQVTFRPPGGEQEGLSPVEGGLVVRLHTEMELV